MVLNAGLLDLNVVPLDWESRVLTTIPLLHCKAYVWVKSERKDDFIDVFVEPTNVTSNVTLRMGLENRLHGRFPTLMNQSSVMVKNFIKTYSCKSGKCKTCKCV